MADIPNLYWQLELDARKKPVAWWAERGEYFAEIEFASGSTLPRSWQVLDASCQTVLVKGAATSLGEAKTAVARAINDLEAKAD